MLIPAELILLYAFQFLFHLDQHLAQRSNFSTLLNFGQSSTVRLRFRFLRGPENSFSPSFVVV